MKTMFSLILIVIIFITLGLYCESKKTPYDVGMHWDYSIICENGFIYKVLGNKRGTIQVLNSDGTPLKCGKVKY
jgi:hypothetical protein